MKEVRQCEPHEHKPDARGLLHYVQVEFNSGGIQFNTYAPANVVEVPECFWARDLGDSYERR